MLCTFIYYEYEKRRLLTAYYTFCGGMKARTERNRGKKRTRYERATYRIVVSFPFFVIFTVAVGTIYQDCMKEDTHSLGWNSKKVRRRKNT